MSEDGGRDRDQQCRHDERELADAAEVSDGLRRPRSRRHVAPLQPSERRVSVGAGCDPGLEAVGLDTGVELPVRLEGERSALAELVEGALRDHALADDSHLARPFDPRLNGIADMEAERVERLRCEQDLVGTLRRAALRHDRGDPPLDVVHIDDTDLSAVQEDAVVDPAVCDITQRPVGAYGGRSGNGVVAPVVPVLPVEPWG